jgi:DNA-binding IclR family transcriptional regulator
LTYDGLLDESRPPLEPEALNTQSISDFSGIPRETVRRKIKELIDRGWIERDESGYHRATRKAALDLHPLTEIGFTYLSRMASVFSTSP